MKYRTFEYHNINATVSLSAFESHGGINEYNLIASTSASSLPFAEQLRRLHQAIDNALSDMGIDDKPMMMRYLLSDPANQRSLIPSHANCAVSVAGQPPLDGSKCAIWAYVQQGMQTEMLTHNLVKARHGAYSHIWATQIAPALETSERCTRQALADYCGMLTDNAMSLAGNCMRTWFFVRDIDEKYAGLVKARNEIFADNGLTPDTHFIASTGIAGSNGLKDAPVTMDAYAVGGLKRGQVEYIQALSHLNPTHQYGVAFERATAIDYGDRRHVLISGTASIDNKGNVAHTGDIAGQTLRMLENVNALLKQARCGWHDATHAIVYLRDPADYAVVSKILRGKLPNLPIAIVLAAVCRPQWLVEMECMAIAPQSLPDFEPL